MTDREQLKREMAKELHGPRRIAPPTLERIGVGYRIVFPELRVEVVIPRVHWHREDAVAIYAIGIIPAVAGQAIQRIDHGSLNLHASTTRARLAKQLQARYEADWEEVLRHTSAAVLEQETMGEEPVELDDIPDDESSPELLDNFCLRDDPTMIFGHGGDAKSYLALAAAVSIATGRPLLGIQPTARLKVAYLDWEWSGAEHKRRKRRLIGDERIEGLYYFRCRHPLPQEVDRLAVQFNRLGIGFAIIDSVAWACGGAPEESGMATAFQGAIRALNVGTLSVAHVNRSGDTNQPFGSVFWHNSMRATWFVKKQQEVGEEEIHLGLFNRKANGSRVERPMGFVLNFADNRTTINKIDPGRVAELAGSLSLRDRMVALLRQENGRPMTYMAMAEALGVDVQQIRNKAQQKVFQILEPDAQNRTKRLALGSPQTGLPEGENRFGGASKPVPKPVGRRDEVSTPGGLVVCPGSEEGENGTPGGLPYGLEEGQEEGSIRCPSCGFEEYQPLGGGRRKCLSCEGVWE